MGGRAPVSVHDIADEAEHGDSAVLDLRLAQEPNRRLKSGSGSGSGLEPRQRRRRVSYPSGGVAAPQPRPRRGRALRRSWFSLPPTPEPRPTRARLLGVAPELLGAEAERVVVADDRVELLGLLLEATEVHHRRRRRARHRRRRRHRRRVAQRGEGRQHL